VTLLRDSGVDYRQWKALVRAHALTDYSALLGRDGPAAARRAAVRLLFTFVVGGVMSYKAAEAVWLAPDVFFAASVMTALTMFIVAILGLSTVVSLVGPDDFAIVGFRPVSSQTYFAARVTALLLGTIEVAVPIGWLPVAALTLRDGGSPAVAAAATVAIAVSSCAVTFALAAVFGLLMRSVSPKKLTRAILSAQTLGFIALFSAYWMPFVDRRAELASIVSVTMSSTSAVLLFPGTWFGSYVALAAGHTSWVTWQAAALSLVAVGVPAWGIIGPLSARYTVALGEHSSESTPGRSISLTRFARFRAERRAMLILLASQARANLNVQAGLLTSALMVVVMGGVFFVQNPDSAAFVLLFGPLNLREALQRSPEHEAAWPFFTTPCSRALAVTTARDALAVFLLGPLLLLFMIVHLAAGSGARSFAHIAAAGLASYLTLQVAVLTNPALPFSMPMIGAKTRIFVNVGAMFAGGIVVFAMQVAFSSRVGIVLVVLGSVLAAFALDKATYWRLRQLERRRA